MSFHRFDYKIIPLPDVWPGRKTVNRKAPQFKTVWGTAEHKLGREIAYLSGKNVTIAIDVLPHFIRNDGGMRADARPRTPAVIVAFDSPDGRLQFPCDTFFHWQANVDAIGRVLEDLRRADRYGVSGRQYTGFKALPASTGDQWTPERAADYIGMVAGSQRKFILEDAEYAREATRLASNRTHPDKGGDPGKFARTQAAKAVLENHHGVKL